MDAATVSTILNNINSLYGNLIAYTVGLILFVGAFVPAVISFFQRRQFSREYEEVSKKLSADVKAVVAEAEVTLKAVLQEDLARRVEELRKENEKAREQLEQRLSIALAGTFHNQANQEKDKLPALCVGSCKDALPLYLDGQDERNARSILAILNGAIGRLNKDTLADRPDVEEEVKTIIDILKKHNVHGRYEHDIHAINEEMKLARKRVPAAAAKPANS